MHKSPITKQSGPNSPVRRHLLAGFVSAYTASLVPWAMAQPVNDPHQAEFLALSAIIAGRRSLDTLMADRIFRALSEGHPEFTQNVRNLLHMIGQRKIDPLHLQKILDDEKSPLAPLPRQIATAWFQGIIGTGSDAHVIAYAEALNAQMVADVLKPPTYGYGPYGSWTRKPL